MTYPPIIPRGLYDEVQRGQAERRHHSPSKTKRPFPLQGLLVCGHCGAHYTPRSRPDRPTDHYACQQRVVYGAKKAGHEDVRWMWPAQELEARLRRYAISLLLNPDRLLQEAQWLNEEARRTLSQGHEQRTKLEKKLADLEAEEANVLRQHRKGHIDDKQLGDQLREVRAEQATAKRELENLGDHTDTDNLTIAAMLATWAAENIELARMVQDLAQGDDEVEEACYLVNLEAYDKLPAEARSAVDAMVWQRLRERTKSITVQDDGTLLVEGRLLPPPDERSS
jgi:hypothetical protein